MKNVTLALYFPGISRRLSVFLDSLCKRNMLTETSPEYQS
jgi:hypothetical protein